MGLKTLQWPDWLFSREPVCHVMLQASQHASGPRVARRDAPTPYPDCSSPRRRGRRDDGLPWLQLSSSLWSPWRPHALPWLQHSPSLRSPWRPHALTWLQLSSGHRDDGLPWLQLSSSLWSTQSKTSSQCQRRGMQWARFRHRNSSSLHSFTQPVCGEREHRQDSPQNMSNLAAGLKVC